MPTRSRSPRGPVLESDTIADAEALATRLHCPIAAVVSALVDTQSEDSARAAQADAELDAWRDGSAVHIRDLADRLPSGPTLAIRLGPWIEEAQNAPFPRSGYGHAFGDSTATVAASTRGFWRIAKSKSTQPARVIAYRRGSLLLHAMADSWAYDAASGRFWADRFYTMDTDGQWVDVDNGKRYKPEPEDTAAQDALSTVPIVIPNGDRNPVAWLKDGDA